MSTSEASNRSPRRRRRTVTALGATAVHPRYDEEVLALSPAAALVEIYARRAYDGPDTLVLRTSGAGASGDRVYWAERAVRRQPQEGALIECAFRLAHNDGTADAPADLTGRRFTLAWRPAGTADDEIIMVEDAPYEAVWNVGDERSVAATMTTARFRECSGLTFPAEGDGLDIDLPAPLRAAYEPLPDDPSMTYPTPDAAASVPVRRRSASGADSGSTGGAASGEGADDAVPGARAPEVEPPPGPRWIALYGVFATEGEDYAPAPAVLGAYQATEGGAYRRAALQGDTLSASGPAQSDVLLPTGHVGTGAVAVFARLVLGTPAPARIEQGADLLQRGGAARSDLVYAATPLFFSQPPPGTPPTPQETGPHPLDPSVSLRLHAAADHARPSEQGPGLDVALVHTLWAAERRVQAAEAAAAHERTRVEETGWADGPSGVVGGLCYDDAHSRTYLSETLASATEATPVAERDADDRSGRRVRPALNLREQWAPFSPDQVRAGASPDGLSAAASRDVLGQFRYGLRCTRAFLAWNRRRAARRAQTLLGSAYVFQALLDLHASPSLPDGRPERVRALFVRHARAGGHPPLPQAPEQLPAAAGTASADPSLRDLTSASLTTVLLALGDVPTEAAYQLTLAAAPSLLAAGANEGLPGAARRLARALMGAGHEAYQIEETAEGLRLHTGDPDRPEVALTRTERSGGRARWHLDVSDGIETDLEAAAAGPEQALRMLNGLVSAAGVLQAIRNETFDVGDAIDMVKLLAEAPLGPGESLGGGATPGAATVAEKGTTLSKVGKHLSALGPVLDVVTAALDVGTALADTDPRGQTEVRDPDPMRVVGAVVGAAGSIAIAVGSWPKAVVGGAGVLLSSALSGASHLEDRLDRKEADPLFDWLPAGSLWGRDASSRDADRARRALLGAVRPAPDGEAPSAVTLNGVALRDVLADELGTVMERGFYFPTGVDVRQPAPDAAPVGLQLDIAVGYLPRHGTLMVDGTVRSTSPDMMGEQVDLACAVHYITADDDLWYRVLPPGRRLDVPGRLEEGLSQWVRENPVWAAAPTGPVELPNGARTQAPRLQVHVGDWPDATAYADDLQAFAQTVLRLRTEGPGRPRAELKHDEQLRRVADSAPPGTVLDGPAELDSILDSVRFEVTGQVYFSPLKSLWPDPTIPKSLARARNQHMSFERVRFSHPNQ